MLRLAVIVLLLGNAGYWAWSQGLLRPWGLGPPQEQTEPERMRQQLRPGTLQLLTLNPGETDATDPDPDPAAPPSTDSARGAASASTTGSTECLRAGVFDERQADALRSAAAGLPAGSWVLEPTPVPGRWMVYMGRFEDLDALEKKRAELRTRKLDFDRAGSTWEPGLSLGRFSSEEAARRELQNLAQQGVRTARVVRERPDATGFTLRLPVVNDALRPQLDALRGALAGKALRSCE